MNTRHLSILLIRLLALVGILLTLSHIPLIFSPHWHGSIHDVSHVFIIAVVITLIIPLVLWLLAPALSRFMASDSQTSITSITAIEAFRVGVCLIGLWIFVNAVFELLGLGMVLFYRPHDLDVLTTLEINRQLYTSLVTGLAQLIIGGLLFFGAAALVRVAKNMGILDHER